MDGWPTEGLALHDGAREAFDEQAGGVLLRALCWCCGWLLRALILAAILFGIGFPIAASQYQKRHPLVVVHPKPGETFR